jgi:hypothetical protein
VKLNFIGATVEKWQCGTVVADRCPTADGDAVADVAEQRQRIPATVVSRAAVAETAEEAATGCGIATAVAAKVFATGHFGTASWLAARSVAFGGFTSACWLASAFDNFAAADGFAAVTGRFAARNQIDFVCPGICKVAGVDTARNRCDQG